MSLIKQVRVEVVFLSLLVLNFFFLGKVFGQESTNFEDLDSLGDAATAVTDKGVSLFSTIALVVFGGVGVVALFNTVNKLRNNKEGWAASAIVAAICATIEGVLAIYGFGG
jgi:hypothetical protein